MGAAEKILPMCRLRNHFPIPLILISTMFFCCNIIVTIAEEINTLNQSDTLNYTTTLVSNNKNFTLGFMSPLVEDNKNYTYLAIWYSSVYYDYPPVCIANRDTPIINDTSPILFIDINGKLVINQTRGGPVKLCPGQQNTTNNNKVKAVLLDNGNLVLIQVNSSDGSEGEILWQSFDCPTDTLLPGMKLGINHRTGRNWTLTSWLASDEPSSGAFTLEWDPHGLEIVVKRRGVIFWTSGALKNFSDDDVSDGLTFGNNGPASNFTRYYKMMYTKTSDEEFFSYTLRHDPLDSNVHEGIRWFIDSEGTIWFENRGLQLQDYCYGYKTKEDEGCAEWGQLQCRIYNTTFKLMAGNFVNKSDGNYIGDILDGKRISPADCRVNCWNDCNCQAYRMLSGSLDCVQLYQDVQFLFDPSGESAQYYIIQRPQNESNTKKEGIAAERNTKKEWIAISVLMSGLLLSVIVIIFYYRRRRKGAKKDEGLLQLITATDTIHSANTLEYDHEFGQNLKIFSFASIMEATNNFSMQNKLGQGGFGTVYKGKLLEGKEIAVKRLSRSSGQGLVEFKNELILIAKLQHMNLVRLIGCCIDNEEKLLVYEYMPNKSLDSFLFDAMKRVALNWRMRVMIIEGISQGLLYLHQHSRVKIIHRDLKVSNILLDEDMTPKISDFGLARLFKRNELMANTDNPVGTYGYMSPEYAMGGIFSIKSDIFSFGVIILEILSGRRNNSFNHVDKHLNLIGYAWDIWGQGNGLELMDQTLSDSCCDRQFIRFVQVALLCVEESPIDRPTISEVISMMTNENTILPIVKKPAFTNLDENFHTNPHAEYGINIMSTSTLTGR